MIRFNKRHIFAGYVKQLLRDANTPNSTGDGWAGVSLPTYYDGKKMLNYQKNYLGAGDLYDTYTHETLGEYLRFYADKTGVNLMPLYNCFSNAQCDDFALTLGNGRTVRADESHVVYMLPIKLGKEYTIAIDEPGAIEICCGLFDGHQLSAGEELSLATYVRKSGMRFEEPLLYDKAKKLFEDESDEKAARIAEAARKHGDALKMFIIAPASNDSSIAVLEGSYLRFCDRKLTRQGGGAYRIERNRSELNLFPDSDGDWSGVKLISELQLLSRNTKEILPFADRLVEYLTGNAITGATDIRDDVVRVQTLLSNEAANVEGFGGKLETKRLDVGTPGLWSDRFKAFLYEHSQRGQRDNAAKHDALGYVDKDLEAILSDVELDQAGERIRTDDRGVRVRKGADGEWPAGSKWKKISMGSIDVYPEIYKDSKAKAGD